MSAKQFVDYAVFLLRDPLQARRKPFAGSPVHWALEAPRLLLQERGPSMGLRAPKAVSSVLGNSALLPILALLVLLEAHRCSAGFATLNLLPHEQLHKGRGTDQRASLGEASKQHSNIGIYLPILPLRIYSKAKEAASGSVWESASHRNENGRHLGQARLNCLFLTGISEDHMRVTRKPARLSEDHEPLSERPSRPVEDQERLLRKSLRPENYTASSGRTTKSRSSSEGRIDADKGLKSSISAEAGRRTKKQEPRGSDLPRGDFMGEQHDPRKQIKGTAAPEPAQDASALVQPEGELTEPEENPIDKERKAIEEERKALAEERRAIERERRAIEQEKIAKVLAAAPKTPPRSKRLDIVLSHFHPQRVQPALDFWLDFLESPKVCPSTPGSCHV